MGAADERNPDARDAERYRKLVALLERSYDGQEAEFDRVTVYCSMVSGWRTERMVEATIRWSDTRDEPLDLGAALDSLEL